MKFTDEQIAQMADGYPPPEYDCEQAITAMSKEIAELRRRLEAVVKVAKEQFDYIFHSPMCWDEDENESHSLEQLREMEALEKVVATARGEGGQDGK